MMDWEIQQQFIRDLSLIYAKNHLFKKNDYNSIPSDIKELAIAYEKIRESVATNPVFMTPEHR